MQQDTPLVSVLMTAYNREKYIAEAIESVVASSYTNFELIIVDDCSKDNTVAIIRSLQEKDTRIKVFVNEQNLGDYKNRNRAASLASGKYLKYLDSDDLIYPWGLEAMVMCMEKFPQAGFGLMSYGFPQESPYPVLVQPKKAYRAFFFQNFLFSMGPSGSIINREVFEKLGGFNGEQYLGDTEFWLRAGALFPVVRMPLDLIWWRQHDKQQMQEEFNDILIKGKRYNRYRELIIQPGCPLSNAERKAVIKNLENVRLRNILTNYLFKFKIERGLFLLKQSNFSVLDLWKAMRKNIYPV